MADSSLQERLREYNHGFDGLLSLIPAKHYYGEDNSDQWKKKKQTKQQRADAKRAKLDPEGAKTAKDIMDERARKRKLEELEEFGESVEGIERETPKQGLKVAQDNQFKKQKVSNKTDDSKPDDTADAKQTTLSGKAQLKQEQRKLKKEEKLAEKLERVSKGAKIETKADISEEKGVLKKSKKKPDKNVEIKGENEKKAIADDNLPNGEIGQFEAEGLERDSEEYTQSTSSPPSPTFDNATDPSTNTSTSSVIPPATKPRHIQLPTDPELLKTRLAARIEALRAARRADGPDGRPARNRQELLEARRKKEEQRKAHKKELRNLARLEEDAVREAALASARDSPASSMMSPAIHSPEHNFSFGRVAFADGQQLSEDMTSVFSRTQKKGPQDPATALRASEKNRIRIAGLDEGKRAVIEEKDIWLNAKKRAHGEKVRDDSSLLKKTLKRKEKAKKKSEKEWGERKEGVAKSIAMKQKKRTENLQKRKDEKGSKGKGSKGKSAKSKKPKVKSRPGFEGTFGSGKRK